jgi:arginine/lysine/ornithine decarboxylase
MDSNESTRYAMSILTEDLRSCWATATQSFHMPGHKGGQGAHPLARELIGTAAMRADLSELSGFGYLHSASGTVALAQRNAARLFGATQSYFLVNGATVGNIAAIVATVHDGDGLLMFRSSHRSVYAGLTLAGAAPVYIDALADASRDLLTVGDAATADAALRGNKNVRAIHVTRPNYYGFCCDLEPYVALAQAHSIPLIVDEAHGTHFAFHRAFPRSALACGADVVIQSPHKTLSSLTQSSLLHVNSERIDAQRLRQTLGMLQSSSPSALLLLSLDIALAQMTEHGNRLLSVAIDLAQSARRAINSIAELNCYGDESIGRAGIAAFDPTKLVVDVSALGITGFAAQTWLSRHHKINPEFADFRRLVFSITLGDSEQSIDTLVTALSDLGNSQISARNDVSENVTAKICRPATAMTPHQANRRPSTSMKLCEIIGRVAAEFVIPYPPGIPLLVPGELIDETTLCLIETLTRAGCTIVGTEDENVRSLRVVNQ